jgi:two-component system, LytTR family, sensor kinase
MEKKNRFSFWKVSAWLIGLNLFIIGLVLIVVYYVKLPNQPKSLAPTFNTPHFLLRMVVAVVFQCTFYYFALNTFYRLMRRKVGWPAYLGYALLFVLMRFVYSIINDLTIKKEDLQMVMDISLKIFGYSLSALVHMIITLVVAAIARQLDEKKYQGRNQKLLEERTFKLEKEKMQADYLFLKAQINPHFLHNTLNFLYARSLPLSPELSEGILTLSEIMRYSLDNHEDGNGKVLLSHEIEHVHNIIRMQQLRFENTLQVQFSLSGEPSGQRILPFILITLVENAFKHGDLKSTENPVKIELEVSADGRMHFVCSNRKKTGPKELSTGIGLDNTRKRLELAYGENYSLFIKNQRDIFTVDLTITL